MIEGKYEDLVNREIDGETTGRESAELQEHLAQSPPTKAYQEDLENLAAMFERVREVEPPQDLRDEIVRAAHAAAERAATAAPQAAEDTSGGWSAIMDALRRRLWMRSPYAFASGLAVGALVFALFAGSFTSLFRVDESVSPGALVPPEALAVYEPVDRQPLRLEGVTGEIATRAHRERLLVELQLESDQAVEVSITTEAGSLIPVAFRQNDPNRGRVAFRDTQVTVRHEGSNAYYVVLRNEAVESGTLRVRARAGTQSADVALRTR